MKSKIIVAGLGPGEMKHLTIETYEKIKTMANKYLRTEVHPCVQELKEQGMIFKSFDHLYQSEGTFDAVYQRIAEELIKNAQKEGEILYLVPGNPLFAEKSVEILIEILDNEQDDVYIEILTSPSFIDATVNALRVDPVRGFSLVDGLAIDKTHLDTDKGILVTQVYNRLAASQIKLQLMEVYPDDHKVQLIHSAGTKEETVETVCLYEMDRSDRIDHLSSLYLPPFKENHRRLESLVGIMEKLRSEEGCPWDRKQTPEMLRKYVIEEAYEVVEAINRKDDGELEEELGDLLLQVVFLSSIAAEKASFTINDVIEGIVEKMIFRHPHVFEDANKEEFTYEKWEARKREEKGHENLCRQMKELPKSFPAYLKALKVQKKATLASLDFENPDQILEKLKEEVDELEDAMKEKDQNLIVEESGDIIFTVLNLLRHLKLEFEDVLNGATDKFIQRMEAVEKRAQADGLDLLNMDGKQADRYWEAVKKERN